MIGRNWSHTPLMEEKIGNDLTEKFSSITDAIRAFPVPPSLCFRIHPAFTWWHLLIFI